MLRLLPNSLHWSWATLGLHLTKTSTNWKKKSSVFLISYLLQVQQSKQHAMDKYIWGTTQKPEQTGFQETIEKRVMYMHRKNWSLNLPCLGTLLSSFLSTEALPPSIVSEDCIQNTLWEEGNGWYCVLQRSKEKLCEKAANISNRKRLIGWENCASKEQERREKEEKHVFAGKRSSS